MRILMTGGYGCIGAWIAKTLLDEDKVVWILDLTEDTHRLDALIKSDQKARVHFVQGDVSDAATVLKTCSDHEITHLLHLAGLQVPTCRANPLLGAKVNVLGTLAIFEAAAALKDQIERVAYASSAAVHGLESEMGVKSRDDALLSPSTHYGAFKICNELNARVYWLDKGVSSVGLRPWTVYGVGRDFGVTSEPTKAIKSVAVGRPYHISYGGSQDLQYAHDVARAFLRSLSEPYKGAGVYNIRGSVASIEEFVAKLRQAAPDAERLVTHGDRQLPIEFDLDDSALERDLGPMPKTTLEKGIVETLEMFRDLDARGKLDLADLG